MLSQICLALPWETWQWKLYIFSFFPQKFRIPFHQGFQTRSKNDVPLPQSCRCRDPIHQHRICQDEGWLWWLRLVMIRKNLNLDLGWSWPPPWQYCRSWRSHSQCWLFLWWKQTRGSPYSKAPVQNPVHLNNILGIFQIFYIFHTIDCKVGPHLCNIGRNCQLLCVKTTSQAVGPLTPTTSHSNLLDIKERTQTWMFRFHW